MNRAPLARLTVALLASLCAAGASAAPFVELLNDTRIEGTEIRVTAKGDVILTTAQGQRTFTKGQYKRAVADKPAAFDAARQSAAAKQYDAAEAALKEVIAKYTGLEWDNVSRVVLAREVYAAKGDYATAVTTFEELLRLAPDRKNSAEIMWAYRTAVAGAKQFDKLMPMLNEAVAGGSREDAARAYVLRGDVKLAQQQVEPAALDYLRAAILFENEADVQPEALYKAGQMLEKLRDPKAGALYETLKSKYPQSPYAAKLAGR